MFVEVKGLHEHVEHVATSNWFALHVAFFYVCLELETDFIAAGEVFGINQF